jgi:hypothetical protein
MVGSRASKLPQRRVGTSGKRCIVSTPNIRPSAYANQRRSQRILLAVPIVVSGTRANNTTFRERTATLVVNAHGALIQLRESVALAQKLKMENVATGEEISCTVMDINPGNTAVPEVGVEFFQPSAQFWRVSFPPVDWTPRSPEAKHFDVKKAGNPPLVVKK